MKEKTIKQILYGSLISSLILIGIVIWYTTNILALRQVGYLGWEGGISIVLVLVNSMLVFPLVKNKDTRIGMWTVYGMMIFSLLLMLNYATLIPTVNIEKLSYYFHLSITSGIILLVANVGNLAGLEKKKKGFHISIHDKESPIPPKWLLPIWFGVFIFMGMIVSIGGSVLVSYPQFGIAEFLGGPLTSSFGVSPWEDLTFSILFFAISMYICRKIGLPILPSVIISIIVGSVSFTVYHWLVYGATNMVATAIVLGFGVTTLIVYHYTKSLIIVMALHGGNNFFGAILAVTVIAFSIFGGPFEIGMSLAVVIIPAIAVIVLISLSRKKKFRRKLRSFRLVAIPLSFIALIGFLSFFVYASPTQTTTSFIVNASNATNNIFFNETAFNDSSSTAGFIFSGSQNFTRYITVPQNSTMLNDTINISVFYTNDTFLYKMGTSISEYDLAWNGSAIYGTDGDSSLKVYSKNGTLLDQWNTGFSGIRGITHNDTHLFVTEYWQTQAYNVSILNESALYERDVVEILESWNITDCTYGSIEGLAHNGTLIAVSSWTNGICLFEPDDGTLVSNMTTPYNFGSIASLATVDGIFYGISGGTTSTLFKLNFTEQEIPEAITTWDSAGIYGLTWNDTHFISSCKVSCAELYVTSKPGNVTDPYIDIGGDGDLEWNRTGQFNSSNSPIILSNMSSEINDALVGCTADANGNCNIPIIFHSGAIGGMNVSNMTINHEYNTSLLFEVSERSDNMTAGEEVSHKVTVNHSGTNSSNLIQTTGYYLNYTGEDPTSCEINGTSGTVSGSSGSKYCSLSFNVSQGDKWLNHTIYWSKGNKITKTDVRTIADAISTNELIANVSAWDFNTTWWYWNTTFELNNTDSVNHTDVLWRNNLAGSDFSFEGNITNGTISRVNYTEKYNVTTRFRTQAVNVTEDLIYDDGTKYEKDIDVVTPPGLDSAFISNYYRNIYVNVSLSTGYSAYDLYWWNDVAWEKHTDTEFYNFTLASDNSWAQFKMNSSSTKYFSVASSTPVTTPTPVSPPSGGGTTTTIIIGAGNWTIEKRSLYLIIVPGASLRSFITIDNRENVEIETVGITCLNSTTKTSICPYITYGDLQFVEGKPVFQAYSIPPGQKVSIPFVINLTNEYIQRYNLPEVLTGSYDFSFNIRVENTEQPVSVNLFVLPGGEIVAKALEWVQGETPIGEKLAIPNWLIVVVLLIVIILLFTYLIKLLGKKRKRRRLFAKNL